MLLQLEPLLLQMKRKRRKNLSESYLYFVHGTSSAVWDGPPIDSTRGEGDFGEGFYTFSEKDQKGLQMAKRWAVQKAQAHGGEPLLVIVKLSLKNYNSLRHRKVSVRQFARFVRRYANRGLTGYEIVSGPLGRGRQRFPDKRYTQFKFEGRGVLCLEIERIERV